MQSSTPGYPLWSSSIVARLVGLRRSLVVLGLAFAAVPVSWRLVVVVMAGATEFLDGALRRLWHVSGAMGYLLDPIADKVFVLVEG